MPVSVTERTKEIGLQSCLLNEESDPSHNSDRDHDASLLGGLIGVLLG